MPHDWVFRFLKCLCGCEGARTMLACSCSVCMLDKTPLPKCYANQSAILAILLKSHAAALELCGGPCLVHVCNPQGSCASRCMVALANRGAVWPHPQTAS